MSTTMTTQFSTTAKVDNVSAKATWDALVTTNAILIDVRTQPEWAFSGLPNLRELGKDTQTISWKFYPTMEVNPAFAQMVEAIAPDKETPIYFLCKTGGRSYDAANAMSHAGYLHCYNIENGFEGDRDALGHRGNINGWKASGLAWEQT